jgi:hypothetical protein
VLLLRVSASQLGNTIPSHAGGLDLALANGWSDHGLPLCARGYRTLIARDLALDPRPYRGRILIVWLSPRAVEVSSMLIDCVELTIN